MRRVNDLVPAWATQRSFGLRLGSLVLLALVASCGSSRSDSAVGGPEAGDAGTGAAGGSGTGSGGTAGGAGSAGGSGQSGTGGASGAGSGGGAGDAGSSSGGAGVGGSSGSGGSGGSAGLDSMRDPIENPDACPVMDPSEGEPCPEYGLICKYGDDPNCRSRWGCGQVCDPVCTEALGWQQNYGKRDCPGTCPASEPTAGDPCTSDFTLCTYGDDPACRSEWECKGGAWRVLVKARDCDGSVSCPDEAPLALTTCDASEVTPSGGRCVYQYGAICTCDCLWDLGGAQASGLQIHWDCSILTPYNGVLDPSCPLGLPTPGSPCTGDSECSYPAADICEVPNNNTTVARCVSGAWEILP